MQQLHLVGFTTEHDALIFSARKSAKSGGFLVALDDKFYDTLDEAGRLRDGSEDGGGKRRGARRPNVPRPESALSPRDIQMRLRAGRSIANVASEAGVDEEWVIRFAAPILAEQAQVVARTQGLTFAKSRLGPSGRPLGESVWWNIADKGVLMAQDTFDQCWTAQHLRDSAWIVRFDFINRKKRQRAEWEVDIREGTLTSRNRLASELGYIEPGRRGRPPAPLPPPAKPVAKRQPAASTAVAKRAPTMAKRAPAKKQRGKTSAARSAAKKRPTAKRGPEKKKKATRRPAAARAATKKRTTVKKRATAKRAPAKKKGTARRSAAKRSTPKRVAATKRAAPKKAAVKRPTAKKAAVKRAPAKRAAPRRPAVKKASRPRQPLRVEADAAGTFDTPAFDTGEPTHPVTIRAPRASEPEPEPEPAAESEPAAEPIADVVEIDDFDNAPLPPPPVLTSTPQARTPRPAPPQRRFGRLRRGRRPPGG